MLPLFVHWDVNPVFFSIGSFEIRYYGLSWALALGISAWLFFRFMKREGFSEKQFDSIFWFGMLATIIGARLGHCFFYEPKHFLAHPIEIFYIRQGGLASHGAAVGLLIGLWLFSRKNKVPYLWSLDRIGMAASVGGAFVRLGNLINSEIYGSETTLPWGFIFVRNGETLPKHPTQLYEALAYFIIFGILMWMYYKKGTAFRRPGVMFGVFLILLFGARLFIEAVKNPQEAFEAGWLLNMGQWLSIPFILAGCVILWMAYRRPPRDLTKIEKGLVPKV